MKSPYGLPADCLECHLRPDNFFCSLSQKSREEFNNIRHVAVFPGDTIIFIQGQTPRGVYLLCQGQVKLFVSVQSGKTIIVRIAKPGEVLGIHSVLVEKPYELTAQTMQPCQMNFVSAADFIRFLKAHNDASLRAAQQISRDCQDAFTSVRSFGLSTSISARVAKFLLASAAGSKVTNGQIRVKLDLTHEEIGQLMGTSRESITRTLSDFRNRCIAELQGSTLVLHNKAALELLAAA
jgi:CRP/FNR family transcriptional regulator, cyclic AMP receptor protein